jgi:uncharacterized protein
MAEIVERIPTEVATHLKFYVYLYVDPRDGKPLYVGKGVGQRVLFHLGDARDSEKTRAIAELKTLGLQPQLEILSHGLEDEETALRIEAAVIDLLGVGELTNAVRGFRSVEMGRMTLTELAGYYAAEPVEVTHPMLLIRINRLYRHNMSALELYEATRGVWRLSRRREGARYACAVFEGVVREVYRIDSWHDANTTGYETRQAELAERDLSGRSEFLGVVAEEDIRSTYRGHSVRSYFKKGQQAPVIYLNC